MFFERSIWLYTLLLSAPLTAQAQDVKRACIDASTQGQTHRSAGQLLEAREQLLACSREACPGVVRDSCSRWLGEVEDLTPSVVLHASDANDLDITDGTISIDGVSYPLDGKTIPLDPGKHVIVLEGPDGTKIEKKLLLASGEKSRLIELRLGGGKPVEAVPPMPATPAPSRALALPLQLATDSNRGSAIPAGAWVLGGVSLVGFGSFAFFSLSASSEFSKLKGACSPSCTNEQLTTGRTNALVADISLGLGVAALAGGITWSLISHRASSQEKAAARVVVAPTYRGGYAALTTSF